MTTRDRLSVRFHAGWIILFLAATLLASAGIGGNAQTDARGLQSIPSEDLSSNVITAHHFFAAHGRRGMIDGLTGAGLEVWIYPFQILRDYRISFRYAGSSTEIEGNPLLSRVVYDSDSVTRVFIGSDFIVHERLSVPPDASGAVISYQIDSQRPLEIVVHATPVLDLMWPGALGGQGVEWKDSLNGFLLTEPLHGYTAVVTATGLVSHDALANVAVQPAQGQQIGFAIRPDSSGKADVFVALNPAHAADAGSLIQALKHDQDRRDGEAKAAQADFKSNTLLLKTPDEAVNRAFALAETALNEAWVCNPDIGCGFVAGYGPTRPQRRPQYDWFFAGDGMVAGGGALSIGDLAQVRDELELVMRWQDKKSGMIWHELSQSAGLIDWAHKYPYMFVHVDTTFQFLAAVRDYVRASGDVPYAQDHWASIESAYSYCRALIDPATALPRIPAGKEGGNEQETMADDLGLSTSWVEAAASMADLSALTGHRELAEEASRAEQAARKAIPQRYWNSKEEYWISGHNTEGQPILERRSGPADAIALHLFPTAETDAVLDTLASASFETDWGVRSVGAGSIGYDPDSYAGGSVWPVATAELSVAFWAAHRSLQALGFWQRLIPLSSLDAPGHMPEVLSGSFYRPQMESVPEQTWSSAGFVSATVHGLLGLDVDGVEDRLTFAPRLPAKWDDLDVEHIHMPKRNVSLTLHKSEQSVRLTIQNSGTPFALEFRPDLPLGADLKRSLLNGRPCPARIEATPQETAALVSITAPAGTSTIDLNVSGGISVIVDPVPPVLGEKSAGIPLIRSELDGKHLLIDADVPAQHPSRLQLASSWLLSDAHGAQLEQTAPGRSELIFSEEPSNQAEYRRAHVEIAVAR